MASTTPPPSSEPLRIEIVDTATGAGPFDAGRIVELSRELLVRAVAAELADDRFSDGWAADVGTGRWVGAVGLDDRNRLVGLAGGLTGGSTARSTTLEVLVDGGAGDRASLAAALVARALEATVAAEGRTEIWIKPEIEGLDLAAAGATPYRRLHQMRVALPIAEPPAPLETRAFRPGQDDEAVVATNNRAFVDHPVQGTLTLEGFRAEMAAPWFDPDGLRIAEIDGRMAGFCWTKIHPAEGGREALGEIYVICVDPDFHGRGLGRPMTNAGLDWLLGRGLRTGMLYVEADNEPAIRTYEGMGFTTVRSDTAWLRTGP